MSIVGQIMQRARRYLPAHALVSLPAIDMAREVAGGCCAHDGYQRGFGLEFGTLREAVWADPSFRKAWANASQPAVHTIVSRDRIANLYLLIRFFLGDLSSKNIIEFGSYRGGSAIFMATLLKEFHPGAKIFALDTFAGMPDVEGERDLHRDGDFNNTNVARIRIAAESMGLDNLELIPGLIQDTAMDVYERAKSFGLAHIDVDIYSAVKYAQDTVWDRMTPGGYVVYDDATVSSCIGATQAVEELVMQRKVHSEQIFPHFVFRSGLEGRSA